VEGLDGHGLADNSVQALVIERQAATRIGYGLLLRSQRWIGRTWLAGDRDDAIALLNRVRPDVAIVDVSDAGAFLSAYLAPLRAARPALPILLSTRQGGGLTQEASQAAGVSGLITPSHSTQQVIAAVRLALFGQRLPEDAGSPAPDALSTREREVLMLLSTGATNREIAASMHVSPETVKKHTLALYRKLGVRNRTEAAQRAPELAAA
jgi:DNA-binding NarL/FixJ family response regulator